jgi:hypothetical protein
VVTGLPPVVGSGLLSVSVFGVAFVAVFGLLSSFLSSSPDIFVRSPSNVPMSSSSFLTLSTKLDTSLIAQETRLKIEAVQPPVLELGGFRRLRKSSANDYVSSRNPVGGPILGFF